MTCLYILKFSFLNVEVLWFKRMLFIVVQLSPIGNLVELRLKFWSNYFFWEMATVFLDPGISEHALKTPNKIRQNGCPGFFVVC